MCTYSVDQHVRTSDRDLEMLAQIQMEKFFPEQFEHNRACSAVEWIVMFVAIENPFLDKEFKKQRTIDAHKPGAEGVVHQVFEYRIGLSDPVCIITDDTDVCVLNKHDKHDK